jgi:hypothetical protein
MSVVAFTDGGMMYLGAEDMQVASSSDESLGVVFSRARQQVRSKAVELSSDKTYPPPLRHERSQLSGRAGLDR